MNIDSFLRFVYGIGSFWYMPILFWIAYFFLSKSLDYPVDLEKHIRNGKVWPYLPMYWKTKKRKFIRIASSFLFWAGNISCASSMLYLLPKFEQVHFSITFFAFGIALSMFIEYKLRSIGTQDIIRLQRDRYFQIFTQLKSIAVSKGNEISDGELLSKAQWQHQNDLRIVDRQGRLMEFLKGEAKL